MGNSHRSRCAHFADHHNGFTLFELLLALVILTAVIGLTVPAVTGWGKRNQATAGVHQVRHSLISARQQAIDEGKPVRWVTQQGETKMSVVFQPNGCATDANIPVYVDDTLVGWIKVIGATGMIRMERIAP